MGSPCDSASEGVIGELVSVWGMTILEMGVFDDEETLAGLCIGKPFMMEMKMDRVTFRHSIH